VRLRRYFIPAAGRHLATLDLQQTTGWQEEGATCVPADKVPGASLRFRFANLATGTVEYGQESDKAFFAKSGHYNVNRLFCCSTPPIREGGPPSSPLPAPLGEHQPAGVLDLVLQPAGPRRLGRDGPEPAQPGVGHGQEPAHEPGVNLV
jgi:hypothetical protein